MLKRSPTTRSASTGIDRFLGDVRTGDSNAVSLPSPPVAHSSQPRRSTPSTTARASATGVMCWPIFIMPTLVPAGIAAVFSLRAAKTILPLVSAVVVANGIQGTYLHARGIAQKPGGWRMAAYNLEMGPPLFAPGLAALVGGMGLLASLLRREDDPAVGS